MELLSMQIRALVEDDYDQLVELYKLLDDLHVHALPDHFIHREKEQVYPLDAFIHNLNYPGCVEFGAFEGSRLVGFASATLWENSGMVKGLKWVCLDNIFVLPAYRRRGIAAKLFAEVESWAREHSAARLELHTWDFNKNAIAMYEAMEMTPQRYVLEKKLQP